MIDLAPNRIPFDAKKERKKSLDFGQTFPIDYNINLVYFNRAQNFLNLCLYGRRY